MLDDLSTDAFINNLRCFIVKSGTVCQIKSDQGTNFVVAKCEFKEVNTDKLTAFMWEKQCDLSMNTRLFKPSQGTTV